MPSTSSRRTIEHCMCATVMATIILTMTACSNAPPPQPVAVSTGNQLLREAGREFEADQFTRALLLYGDAESHFRSLDDNEHLALALISQAEILLLLGENELLEDTLQELSRTIGKLPQRQDLAARETLLQAGHLAARGDTQAARKRVVPLLERKDGIGEAARILDCREQLRETRSDCADKLESASALGKARILRLRATAATQRGDFDPALQYLDKASQIYRAQHYRPGIAANLQERGEILALRNNGEADRLAALDAFTRAIFIRAWMRDSHHARLLARAAMRLDSDLDPENAKNWRALLAALSRTPVNWFEIQVLLEDLR